MVGMKTQSKLARLLKLLISVVFFCQFGFWNLIRRLMGNKAVGSSVVLYYHGVPSEERAQFARQLDTVVRLAKPITTDVRFPLNTGEHYVAITFDDGFESILVNAIPELKKRRIPSTIFVPTQLLGQFPPWLTTAEDQDRNGKLMSVEQLQRLPADLVTIGSHGKTHCLLPSLNEECAKRELSESRTKLEELLNRRITVFSFPFGALSQDLVGWCREAGYERVFTSSPVIAFADPQEFETGRVWAEPTDWPLEFRLKILGAYRWLPWAIALKRKVLSFKIRLWSV